LLVALDPGLLDTAISGARSYAAPELMGVAALGLTGALYGSRVGLLVASGATILAIDHHAMAAGTLLGWALIVPTLARSFAQKDWAMAMVVAGFLGLPRFVRSVAIADCGDGVLTCLSGVSGSNVDPEASSSELLWGALRDRAWVDLGWLWLPIAIGTLLALIDRGTRPSRARRGHVGRPTRILAIWTVGGLLGIFLLGWGIDYLRSYHLRILAVPFSIVTVLGLVRWIPVTLSVTASVVWLWGFWTPLAPAEDLVGPTDRVAASLRSEATPVWVDRIWWDGDPCLEPSGVVLSAILGGQDPQDFQLDPTASFVLIECGSTVHEGPTAELTGTDWRVRHFVHADVAESWVLSRGAEPIQRGGAWDWASVLHPDTVRLEDTEW
jgi:hypothetical protein